MVQLPALLARPYTFTLTATDPDGDTIRYRLDWGSKLRN